MMKLTKHEPTRHHDIINIKIAFDAFQFWEFGNFN